MIFSGDREEIARFVADLLLTLNPDLLSITITVLGSSEGCSAFIATSSLLEDTVWTKARNYSLQRTIT